MRRKVRNFLAEAWSFSKKHWIISLILGIIISLFIIDNFFPFNSDEDDSGLTMPDTTAYVNKNVANADNGQVNNQVNIQEPGQSSQASQTTQTNSAQSNTKNTLLCIRLNGSNNMHLPALMGNQMRSVVPNGHDGFNWNFQPIATGQEDYGQMPNGVIFFKEAFLVKWGLTSGVEIKCDKTNWSPLQLQKGTINGQPAYIYK